MSSSSSSSTSSVKAFPHPTHRTNIPQNHEKQQHWGMKPTFINKHPQAESLVDENKAMAEAKRKEKLAAKLQVAISSPASPLLLSSFLPKSSFHPFKNSTTCRVIESQTHVHTRGRIDQAISQPEPPTVTPLNFRSWKPNCFVQERQENLNHMQNYELGQEGIDGGNDLQRLITQQQNNIRGGSS
jgi:hypothetical protein